MSESVIFVNYAASKPPA